MKYNWKSPKVGLVPGCAILFSLPRRAACLNPNCTEAGAGCYFNQPSRYDGYYTIDFASPANLKEAAE